MLLWYPDGQSRLLRLHCTCKNLNCNSELSFPESADRELSKLDMRQARRILKFLRDRIAKLDDPRS